MLNKEEFDFLGITKWHEAGYKGRNVIIASQENTIEGIFDDIDAIEYEDDYSRFSVHGTNVMDYIRQVAPEARKVTAEMSGRTSNGVLYSEGMDYLQKIVPDILTTSIFFSSDYKNPKLALYKQLYDKGCFLCSAAGNDGYDGVNKINNGDMWKAIGACRYNKGKPKRASYSSVGEELDFMSFDNLRATWDNKKHTGTSFASPLFAAMLALVQGFFLEKTGKKLTHEKLIQFVKDNCIDLGDEGVESQHGYGLFILPDPDSIDIAKYSDVVSVEEVFKYLQNEGELLEPDYWKEKIAQEDKLKWLFIKWANAVRVSKHLQEKNFDVINNYKINDVMRELNELGCLLEPDYWREKIAKEDKLKWMFFKWYYAVKRMI